MGDLNQLVSDAVAAMYMLARIEIAGWSDHDRELARQRAVDTIGMADTLVAGNDGRSLDRRRPSNLAAVVRAVAMLAESPGGVTFMGRHYCVTEHETADAGTCGPCHGRTVT